MDGARILKTRPDEHSTDEHEGGPEGSSGCPHLSFLPLSCPFCDVAPGLSCLLLSIVPTVGLRNTTTSVLYWTRSDKVTSGARRKKTQGTLSSKQTDMQISSLEGQWLFAPPLA